MPNTRAAIAAFLMCLLATGGMLASTRAWIGGNMLLVSCLGFSAIPFSELIGVFFFKNIPDMLSLIGMTIVAAAGMIATVYTKRRRKPLLPQNKRLDSGRHSWNCTVKYPVFLHL